MRKILVISILCILLSACGGTISESSLQYVPADSVVLFLAEEATKMNDIYAYSGSEDIFVMRWQNSFVRTPLKVTLDVTEGKGYDFDFRLRVIMPTNGRHLTIHVPLKEGQRVFVNGREMKKIEMDNGFVAISRTWNSGDEIFTK